MTIRNTGNVVDQFDVSMLGEPGLWTIIQPPSVSLFPGGEQTVDIIFHPPKASAVVAGQKPFGIKAQSQTNPQDASVEEGVIDVLPFDDRTAELLPRTSRGRRRATHDLAIDNRGNAPANLQFSAMDAEAALGYEFEPAALIAQPGTAQFVKVTVKPHKSFWRGQPKTLPFFVSVDEEGKPPLAVDGTMLQIPILPKWFWKAVILLLVLAILLVVLWFTLVKPQIKSSAQDAVAPVNSRLDAAGIPTIPPGGGPPTTKPGGGAATTAPKGGATTLPGGTTVPGTATTTAGTGTTIPGSSQPPATVTGESALGAPFDHRLQAHAAPAANATDTFTVPAGKVLSLTDIVLQNPQGDVGRITLSRNGSVLLDFSLANFGVQDLHYISPVVFNANDSVVLTVTCTTPGPNTPECVDAASLGGFVK